MGQGTYHFLISSITSRNPDARVLGGESSLRELGPTFFPVSFILEGGSGWRAWLTCCVTMSVVWGKTFHLLFILLSNRGKQIPSPFHPVMEKSMPRIFEQQLKKQITFVSLIYHSHNSIIGLFQLGHCIIMKHVRKILKLNKYKEIKLPNLLIWTITTAHPHPLFGYISEPLKKLITFSSTCPITEVRRECVSNEWLIPLTLPHQHRQKKNYLLWWWGFLSPISC